MSPRERGSTSQETITTPPLREAVVSGERVAAEALTDLGRDPPQEAPPRAWRVPAVDGPYSTGTSKVPKSAAWSVTASVSADGAGK